MVRARKFTKKKRITRKQNRRFNRRMMLGNPKQKVYYFKRHVDLSTLVAGNDAAFTNYSLEFKLSDVPNYTEFTALYDNYRINAVKVSFIPVYNISSMFVLRTTDDYVPTLSSTKGLPYFTRTYSCIDYTDDNELATGDNYRQYANCKVKPICKIHKRYLKPRVLMDIGEAGSVNPIRNPWLASETPSVPYYSLKFGWEPLPTGSVASGDAVFKVEAVYYMSFKTPH